MDNLPLSAAVLEAYKKAPPAVQELLRSEKLPVLIAQFKIEFKLADIVATQLENEVLLLILGINSPDDLMDNLLEIEDFPDEYTVPIIEALTKRLFAPLRPAQAVVATDIHPKIAPIPASLSKMVAPVPQPAVPPKVSVAQTKPAVPVTVRPTPPGIPPKQIVPAVTTVPAIRTMKSDVVLAKMPPTTPPVRPVAPAPFVRPVPPPVVVKPVVPVTTPTPLAVPPTAPKPAVPKSATDELKDTLKQYGVDPYRELPQ